MTPRRMSWTRAAGILVAVAALADTSLSQTAAPFQLATHGYEPYKAYGIVTVEDLDGDGIQDLLIPGVGEMDQYGVLFVRGLGDGSFAPSVLTLASSTIHSLACADADADGQRDVVALGSGIGVNSLEFFKGLGGGELATPLSTPLSLPSQVYLAGPPQLVDLDADGLPEVGSLAGNDSAFLIDNLGGGTFGGATELKASGGAHGLALDFGDTDGDGDLDALLLRDDLHAALEVFANDGLGGLTAQPPTADLNMLPVYFEVADLDGDGLADAVVHSGPARQVARNVGQGQFVSVSFELGPVSPAPLAVDVNGDSRLDLVCTGSDIDSGYQTWILVSLATGSFTYAPPIYLAGGSDVILAGVRDVDGDGVVDLVLMGGSFEEGSQYIVLHGLGTGSFESPQRIGVGFTAWDLTALDAEGDGDLDIVSVNYLEYATLFSNESGDLGPATSLGVAFGAGTVESGDLNGDGLDDLVVNLAGSDAGLVPHLNVTQGSDVQFVAAPAVTPPMFVWEMLISDMDADGDLDLMPTETSSQQSMTAFANQGDASFQLMHTFNLGHFGRDAAFADLDDDGLPDALFTVGKPGPASILRFDGLGNGDFAPGADIPVSKKPDRLAVADFDQDGLIDLAVGAYAQASIMILHNEGAGSLAEVDEVPVYVAPDRIVVLDADHDGFPDILTSGGMQLILARNEGDGTLEKIGEIQADYWAINHLVAADFDDDGDADLAFPVSEYEETWVYENTSPAFANLGSGLAASFGTPELVTTGAPVPDQAVSFTAEGVPAPAFGFLIIGTTTVNQPFKGGTLVPAPDAALLMRPDDPLAGRWPPLASGAALYFQAWFEIAGEFAATNAVAGVTH